MPRLTSIGRLICVISSRQLIVLQIPPLTQNTLSLTVAAKGRQLKQSSTVFHRPEVYRAAQRDLKPSLRLSCLDSFLPRRRKKFFGNLIFKANKRHNVSILRSVLPI
ncbi:hypothetical protein VFPPC_16341 [Pochonia chlamydosporia 170]|uniref:Uncharacterized protein n=1 Tax=Pochonia chlamydosporia 170 TaxID=1380566 RepID=A0A179FK21_METCM|nr:hypothetical protein VFPPC_16341 [Pochonia chlamydosporia 170]OAQ65383.1 hypothetical protein VFPPC_16341 [Pochonia chlamydosporia 170]